MPLATFDGVNLNVNIPSTGGDPITMDAQEDFYEPWKDFLRQGAAAGNMNNKRFPQTFRPIAGDEIITGGIKYAGMFFLRNDLGWRLQLPDEDVTLIITGNMALQDTTLPFFRARAGRTGAILGLATFVTNAALDTQIVEGTRTFQEALRLILAAAAGDVAVPASFPGSLTIVDPETKAKTRITATVDANGNRTVTAIDDT